MASQRPADIGSKPIFTRGPSQTVRLGVAIVASLLLMIAEQGLEEVRTARAWLSTLAHPIYLLANAPVALSRWASEGLSSRAALQGEAQRLREENLVMEARQQKLRALEAENLRLRTLLNSSFKLGERILISELVSVDLAPYKHQIVIDKGSISGVFEGQPVVDAYAVLGQVVQVTAFNSTVLMVTDASHALPVELNRNGLRAVAVGTGRMDGLELLHIPVNADIRQGDLVVTSGLGGRFPSGYPVGTVKRVERYAGESFAVVEVEPSARLDRVREVLLVWPLTGSPEGQEAQPAPGCKEGGPCP